MRSIKPVFTSILFICSLTGVDVVAVETSHNPVLQGCESSNWVSKGRDFYQECEKKGKKVCIGEKVSDGAISNTSGSQRHNHLELPSY